MAAPSGQSHEWHIGSAKFRLAPKELTGKLPHTVEPIPFLSQQIQSTAERSYTDINQDREVAFAQDSAHKGLADNLRFNLERQFNIRYAKNADTSVPGIFMLPGPKVNTIGSAIGFEPTGPAVQRGSVFYFAAGTRLYQVATSSSTPVLDTTFAAAITALYVWDGFLIVGLGSSNNFEYRASDTSGGAFTGGGVVGHFFCAVNDQIFRSVNPNTLANAQAVTGPWVTYDIGDASYNITSLGVLDHLVIVGKEDGPYGFDSDLVAIPIAPELRLQSDAWVGKVAAAFNRDYYFTSRRGIVRIRPGEGLRNVGLDTLADPALPGNESRPMAFTTDGRFLYALVVPQDGTDGIYVWKRDLADAWHNYLYRTDLGDAADMLIATNKIGSTSVNAIVFAYASGANWQLAYARWPATADPTKDSAYTFETAVPSVVRTLDYTASYPTVQKYSDRLKSVGDNMASTREATYSAYVDDETSAVTLGEFQKSPHQEVVLNKPIEYHRGSLEVSLTSEAATAPKLRAFHLSAALQPRVVRKHTIQILAADNEPLLSGGRSRSRGQHIVDKIRELRADGTALKCVDENQREFTGYVGDPVEWPAQERQGEGFSPVWVVTLVVREVTKENES